MPKTNTLANYPFLQQMYRDDYYPDHLVDNGVLILKQLCQHIEQAKPDHDEALFALTHAATEQFNQLQEDFWQAESEIETVARENIADDFAAIVQFYGFDVDIEEVIATRDW